MRKILSGLLIFTLFFTLTACSGREYPRPAPTETAPAVSPSPEEQLAADLLASMTVEERVAQLFLVRCPEKGAAAFAEQYRPGGFVLFERDFKGKTPAKVKADIASYQKASAVPMLIAVDEEGGGITRVSRYKAFRAEPFGVPRELYAAGGIKALREDAQAKAELLLGLGINVNLAPVCDLTDDPEDFIYARSLGGDGETVGECVAALVETMNEAGLGCTLKHFPGYGNNEDTHTGIAYDHRDLETFRTADFLPFAAGIRAGAGCVMVSHNIVYAMDERLPASLSPEVHRILREELGFEGVVVTDDLSMNAIGDFTDGETAAVLAVEAGNDLLCCSDFETQYPAVLEAVQSGRIPEERLDESVRRVLLWKIDLGLLK